MNSTAPLPEGSSDLRRLIDVGIALSAEKNHNRLMERILLEAKGLCNADGGTFYLKGDDDLAFAIVRNDSMNIALGGTTGRAVAFPSLKLHDPKTGDPNHNNVATHAALAGQAINIPDAYTEKEFDFSGAKEFDRRNNYHSKSFLTVPLKNYEGEVVGVIQLINAKDRTSGAVIPFSTAVQPLVEALAGQAAVALDNRLLLEAQKDLLESFVQLIASAIDRKSPYTSGHCQRVPVLTDMLAEAACEATAGTFRDFTMTEEELYELHMAAWMHDCGKITTPEWVMDKSTKLQTIDDRVETVRTRFAVLRRDAEIAALRRRVAGGDEATIAADLARELGELDAERAFIETCNVGGEFMEDEKIERVKRIAMRRWRDAKDQEQPLLSDNEVYNLSIRKGTLTGEERKIINDHVVATIEMLSQLPFPKNLRRVPEYAGGHHERMDGTGYPKGLVEAQMSIPARMMAIADIYEALTAADRPYKKAMTLSQSLKIMKKMSQEKHIDADLFRLFVEAGVYRKYAQAHLKPEQIDAIDEAQLLSA